MDRLLGICTLLGTSLVEGAGELLLCGCGVFGEGGPAGDESCGNVSWESCRVMLSLLLQVSPALGCRRVSLPLPFLVSQPGSETCGSDSRAYALKDKLSAKLGRDFDGVGFGAAAFGFSSGMETSNFWFTKFHKEGQAGQSFKDKTRTDGWIWKGPLTPATDC